MQQSEKKFTVKKKFNLKINVKKLLFFIQHASLQEFYAIVRYLRNLLLGTLKGL